MKGHTDSVDQLRWDPKNPNLLGTASGDKTVRIWDARTNKCVHAIETRGENINIRWSPDGQHIAVGDKEVHHVFMYSNRSVGIAAAPQHTRTRLCAYVLYITQ